MLHEGGIKGSRCVCVGSKEFINKKEIAGEPMGGEYNYETFFEDKALDRKEQRETNTYG